MCYPNVHSQQHFSRSDRYRFLLSLVVLGAGLAGGARAGFAQDTVAPNAATSQTPPAAVAPVAPDPQQNDLANPQNGKDLTDKEKAALRKQLDTLMQQRTQLNSQINDLRRQLGERGTYYSFNLNGVNGMNRLYRTTPLAIAPQSGRKLTDEEKRQVQEATRQAQSAAREAMRQAQEAMRQAQRAMEEANRAMQRSGGGNFIMPALPSLPKLNFNFDQDTLFKNGNDARFDFQFNDDLFDADRSNSKFNFQLDKALNSGAWKQWQEKMQKEFGPKFQERFEKAWKQQQPEFEKKMRLFEKQMKEQQLKQAPPPSREENSKDTSPDRLKDKLREEENEQEIENRLDSLDTDAPASAHSPI